MLKKPPGLEQNNKNITINIFDISNKYAQFIRQALGYIYYDNQILIHSEIRALDKAPNSEINIVIGYNDIVVNINKHASKKKIILIKLPDYSSDIAISNEISIIEAPIAIYSLVNLIENNNQILIGNYNNKNVILDKNNRRVIIEKQYIDLTDKEFELVNLLSNEISKKLDKDYLLKEIWGFSSNIDTHTLETHIYNIRNKIRSSFGIANAIKQIDEGYIWEIEKS